MHTIKNIFLFVFLLILLFVVDISYSSYSINKSIQEQAQIEYQKIKERNQLNERIIESSPTSTEGVFSGSIETPKKGCAGSYKSSIHQVTFTYDQCFFGKAIAEVEGEEGCGLTNKPAEKITFESSPFMIYVNQICGIFYESSLPIQKQYKLETKSGQVFHINTRAYKYMYSIEAYYWGKNSIEIVSKTDANLYTDTHVLENKLNTIIQTMETDL